MTDKIKTPRTVDPVLRYKMSNGMKSYWDRMKAEAEIGRQTIAVATSQVHKRS